MVQGNTMTLILEKKLEGDVDIDNRYSRVDNFRMEMRVLHRRTK